jgi:hypothetical protein
MCRRGMHDLFSEVILMRTLKVVFLAGFIVAAAQSASAQELTAASGRPAFEGVEVAVGLMDFDLSGTGQTLSIDMRGAKALNRRLALEFGVTVARPQQQFGGSSLFVPEAQLTYSWKFGRVRPFVRGGGGLAHESKLGFEARWRPSLSGGGGARIQLTDRLHAIGEMRLRGIGRSFGGSTAEWLGGIGWSLR